MASEAIIHHFDYGHKLCISLLNISIDYVHPPERVEKILLDAIFSTEGILKEPKPTVNFKGFEDWTANYSINFYLDHHTAKDSRNQAVWRPLCPNHYEITLFHPTRNLV
jgi:branched-chain amino acid transport system substrate-binding protein